jgi:hypothetical protein
LKSADGQTIHSVAYNSDWYHNDVKAQGGWTLEMKDPANGCVGEPNWLASININGGTPGSRNSIDEKLSDTDGPELLYSFATDSVHVKLVFNKSLDSVVATDLSKYSINNSNNFVGAEVLPPLFHSILLQLSESIIPGKAYEVKAKELDDCIGNTSSTATIAKTGLAVTATYASVVINEILFNPRPGTSDYVELYNNSDLIVDAGKLYIASRSPSGNISSLTQIASTALLLFPNDYLLITENPASLALDYFVKDASAVLKVPSLPSFADDKGIVVLLNEQGDIVDELQYTDKWQFALINNPDGVALERIDPREPTQNIHNWHSASSDARYGTPGYVNSQIRTIQDSTDEVNITPHTFSPDNDGFDDMLSISYHFPYPGFVCNLTIFDIAGRPVRYLIKNNLCGTRGYYRWDGLNEKNQKLPIGIYFLLIEVFNLEGKVKRFKQAVVLARKL